MCNLNRFHILYIHACLTTHLNKNVLNFGGDGVFFVFFLLLLFFKNFSKKNNSGKPSECETFWI